MDLRILYDEDGYINIFQSSESTIEIRPNSTVSTVVNSDPNEWNLRYTELSPEEVKDVIDVIRTILKERLNNV